MEALSQSQREDFLSQRTGLCHVFDGDWVWDESYPLYESKDCRFLDEGFRCSENGRPDLFYTKWRWQPRHCNLPRFLFLFFSNFLGVYFYFLFWVCFVRLKKLRKVCLFVCLVFFFFCVNVANDPIIV